MIGNNFFLILSTMLLLLFACKGTKEATFPSPNHPLSTASGWQSQACQAVSIRFDGETGYNIRLDVNSCFGAYQRGENGSIQFPEYAACTEMCCDSKEATAVLEQIHQSDVYAIHGDTLILSGAESKLYFLPATESSSNEKE